MEKHTRKVQEEDNDSQLRLADKRTRGRFAR